MASAASTERLDLAEKVKRAVEVYVYGYPLVYNVDEMKKFPAGEATLVSDQARGYNDFGKARALLDPSVKFVSPNNDTLYLIGVVDVGGGPVVLHVPDLSGRYYVLQFVDAWTNNFAYVGRRATGTKEGDFLLTPVGYDGPVPDGMSVIEAPSRVFVVLGRIQTNGVDDVPAVQTLQDQFRLTPFSDSPRGPGAGAPVGIPEPASGVADDLLFWEKFRVALAAFPPPSGDKEFVEAAAEFGLTDDASPYTNPDAGLRGRLIEAEKQAKALIDKVSKTSLNIVDGWSSAKHVFDYNLDRCGPGTLDTPEWKIADRKRAYVVRAVAARLGMWGNHGYEADPALLWQDANGDVLDGSRRYELTLSPPPPVEAFWSLTMYAEPDYYLVENPLDRYSIGDRTPGLQVADDGSITIYMQHTSPGADKESNWLPAPAGKFRPLLRAYQPGQAIQDGTYKLPTVSRLD
jgi:hypothetical protein